MTPTTILSTAGNATSQGSWVAAGDWSYPVSLYCTMVPTTGDAFDIRVSNNPVQPLDSADESSYFVWSATPQVKAITEPYAWIKVKKTAATQTTAVYVMAQQRK